MADGEPGGMAGRGRAADPALSNGAPTDWRARAASLAGRVIALDEEVVRLRAGNAHGPDAATRGPSRAPRRRDGLGRAEWRLADDPALAPEALEKFDRRPDDPAILAARQGAKFLDALGESASLPALRRAALALAQGRRVWRHDDPPDVSVVIPVHGQLPYTLNCLQALVLHASRATFEVIVVDDASPDRTGDILGALAGLLHGLTVIRNPTNKGFIAACNAGAVVARGRILVMLNNDTRVAEGWLDALVDSFTWFPRAGLVGSKLLYPDGTLQEAGGIVWRDGSAWNFGRGEDPNQPATCHARQVDYCSGASIAMPAALWRDLGGFDTAFAPAYCEDSDLALRTRARGHEVWLQPLSRVIHYEGRTAGTDTAQGAKAHQVVNLKRLFIRWHATLAAHGRPMTEPYFERERTVTRRALVVDASAPTPNQDAGSVTTVLSIRLLQRLGYKVHFVPQDNFLFQPGPTGDLQKLGVECAYAPFDLGFADYMARYGHLFDAVLVFRAPVLERTIADIRRHTPQAVLLFNNMDLHYLRIARAAAADGDALAAARAAEMKTSELALIAAADVTITPSTFERDLLAQEAPGAAVELQPFLFESVGTQTGFAPRRDFVFLGGYGHAPNVDAAKFFVREVLPLIRRRLPGARVVLAGANPNEAVRALAGDGVEVPGMIDDLGPLFDAARVFVCPVRVGAGVKGKVVTAMAHGLPVVSTSCGAEGMDIADGREVLIADDPLAFAAACVRLHGSAPLWQSLSQAGLDYVARACSLAAGEAALSRAIDRAWARKLGVPPASRESPVPFSPGPPPAG